MLDIILRRISYTDAFLFLFFKKVEITAKNLFIYFLNRVKG